MKQETSVVARNYRLQKWAFMVQECNNRPRGGKKNWVMIDTIAGAEASAIVYSLSETAKANNLKPYDYFEYLLTEIPKHMDDTDRSFLEDLLP